MSNTGSLVIQILQKYVVHSKLKAKLEDKCGQKTFEIDIREDDILIKVPEEFLLTDVRDYDRSLQPSSYLSGLIPPKEEIAELLPEQSMWSQRAPGRERQKAANIRETLKQMLHTLRERYPDDELYVPYCLLSKWVTKDVVGEWISDSKANSSAKNHFRDQIMESALKTFCILIEIEREDAIGFFFEKAHSELGPDREVSAMGHDEESVKRFVQDFPPNLEPWPNFKCLEFREKRRKYFAASLEYCEVKKLDDMDILPFRRTGKPRVRGDNQFQEVLFDACYLLKRPKDKHEIPMMIKKLPATPFEKEETIIQHLQAYRKQPHPHIVEVYGVYIQKKSRHLMMPLCDGDLSKLLYADKQAEHFHGEERYLSEMLNIAKALKSVHMIDGDDPLFRPRGVHHDIKPDNILLWGGKFILSDFGLARVRPPTVSPDQESNGIDKWWSAPETKWTEPWKGEAGPKSDVFSLGCIFLELLVHMKGKAKAVRDFRYRRRPDSKKEYAPFWVGERNQERLSSAVEQQLSDIGQEGCRDVVQEMLKINMHERPDIQDIVEKLQKIQTTDGEAPSSVNATNDGHLGEVSGHPGQTFNRSKVGASVDVEDPCIYAAGSHSDTGGSHLSNPSDKIENSTEPITMDEVMSPLRDKCNHEDVYQKLLGTAKIPPKQHGRIKMLWKGKLWISNWAKESTSSVLILRGDNRPYDREILSCVSSHIIKDALQCLSTGNMVMIVLHHFCHENSKDGDEAVTVMMQSLIHQLLSTPSGRGVLPSLKSNLSTSRLEDLWEMLSSLVQALSPHTRVVCVIDGLQAYCKPHIREKRDEDMQWLIPRFIEVASGRQGVACRFKLFLTTSEVLTAASKISNACREYQGQSFKIDGSKQDNQELRDSFWMGNKLGWA